ncbi:succinate dehydrogenase, hydrophobic membrane anchor protein [Prosthecomicrobium sp. N25]|uniref:succinate dehydrogenase, hydrophobic membrane anchor protein n=1 Tax=Prosthecomicrobium sp. N25 TaxID=3129254 RepID=UPI0030782DF0
MSMRTPLGRVRGLGSARDGTSTWFKERLTSLALVPLTFVFVAIVIGVVGKTHAEAVAMLGSPITAILFLALILVGVAHMRMGMQVIIEDYVHAEPAKMLCLVANTFFSALIALACVWAVLKLSFGI